MAAYSVDRATVATAILAPLDPTLQRDAAELAHRISTLTSSPAALLLPAPVRQAIRELAQMVQRLAVEVTTR